MEDQDQDTKVSRYLAFDILFIDGTPIWQKKLEKRLQCLQNEVILARKNVSPSSFPFHVADLSRPFESFRTKRSTTQRNPFVCA